MWTVPLVLCAAGSCAELGIAHLENHERQSSPSAFDSSAEDSHSGLGKHMTGTSFKPVCYCTSRRMALLRETPK